MGMGEEPGQGKDFGATAPQSLSVEQCVAELRDDAEVKADLYTGEGYMYERGRIDACADILAFIAFTRETAKQSPPKEVSRGEEPERLRAADEGWKMTAEHVGDKCPFGHPWDANEQLATALAEVERLARENEELAKGEWRDLWAVDLERAEKAEREVERLAGERDKAYRATGEYALRANKAQAECERLAGRVAARDKALQAIAFNAASWHGDIDAKDKALKVIAGWARDIDSIPDGVLAALADGGGSE